MDLDKIGNNRSPIHIFTQLMHHYFFS